MVENTKQSTQFTNLSSFFWLWQRSLLCKVRRATSSGHWEEFWQFSSTCLVWRRLWSSSRVSSCVWEDDQSVRKVCCRWSTQTSSLQYELSCAETTRHFGQRFCHSQNTDSWKVSHLQNSIVDLVDVYKYKYLKYKIALLMNLVDVYVVSYYLPVWTL